MRAFPFLIKAAKRKTDKHFTLEPLAQQIVLRRAQAPQRFLNVALVKSSSAGDGCRRDDCGNNNQDGKPSEFAQCITLSDHCR